MQRSVDIAIHANLSVEWQVRYAEVFKNGVPGSRITVDPRERADVHIVLGPHFSNWRTNDTILVDRCFYRGDPDHVSVGWIKDGHRVFHLGVGRKPPKRKPLKSGHRSIFLADYKGKIGKADKIRYHPAEAPGKPLLDELKDYDIAYGYRTTALVTAALEGLKTTSFYDQHILNQTNWLELLPYADWSFEEIFRGELWRHLESSRPPLPSR